MYLLCVWPNSTQCMKHFGSASFCRGCGGTLSLQKRSSQPKCFGALHCWVSTATQEESIPPSLTNFVPYELFFGARFPSSEEGSLVAKQRAWQPSIYCLSGQTLRITLIGLAGFVPCFPSYYLHLIVLLFDVGGRRPARPRPPRPHIWVPLSNFH